MCDKPLVSIIIRTCGRPEILRNALDSIKKQTYHNIEIVVIEDGSTLSKETVEHECMGILYQYLHTEMRQGRSAVGNMGMAAAKGEFINFLDDDDILLPNHVDTLMELIIEKKALVAYSIAEEHQIQSKYGKNMVKRKLIRYAHPYSKLLLCYMNCFPIQSVMFHHSLFERHGGFDESLDALEDWDMWLRFSETCDFYYVPKVTSVYYTPYKGSKKRERDIIMRRAEKEVVKKHATINVRLNAEQAYYEMDYILNQFTKKSFIFYVKKLRDFLLYRDS